MRCPRHGPRGLGVGPALAITQKLSRALPHVRAGSRACRNLPGENEDFPLGKTVPVNGGSWWSLFAVTDPLCTKASPFLGVGKKLKKILGNRDGLHRSASLLCRQKRLFRYILPLSTHFFTHFTLFTPTQNDISSGRTRNRTVFANRFQ